MQDFGKLLIIFGAVIALLGVVLLLGPRIPFIGRLPGDIVVERERFRLYIPIASSVVISLLLTLLLWLIRR